MRPAAYYNEKDAFAAAWLRELIKAGLIAPGEVDERDIWDVVPADLAGFTQCHFFAGIGTWSYALRCAGWPDDRPAWTGSCPCQPFSAAGEGKGFTDERHLWPVLFHLILAVRPPVIFGEQVSSKLGLAWFDLVCADLESEGYACGAIDSCAAGSGAPHIRQRLYWMAHSCGTRLEGYAWNGAREDGWPEQTGSASEASDARGLGHTNSLRWERRQKATPGHNIERSPSQRPESEYGAGLAGPYRVHEHGAGPTNGLWRAADWLFCRDGKWRPVEPGTFPLAHGIAARVGRLRGYGNAICAPQAEAFIRAFMGAERDAMGQPDEENLHHM